MQFYIYGPLDDLEFNFWIPHSKSQTPPLISKQLLWRQSGMQNCKVQGHFTERLYDFVNLLHRLLVVTIDTVDLQCWN